MMRGPPLNSRRSVAATMTKATSAVPSLVCSAAPGFRAWLLGSTADAVDMPVTVPAAGPR